MNNAGQQTRLPLSLQECGQATFSSDRVGRGVDRLRPLCAHALLAAEEGSFVVGTRAAPKNNLGYWPGSRQILKAATTRFRALKPLIELLAVPNPLAEAAWLGRFLHRSHKLNWERCGRHCRDDGELCPPGLYPGHHAIQVGFAPAE